MKIIIQLMIFFLIPSYVLSHPQNAYVSEEIWQEVEPYLMTDEHPIKSRLDKIFKTNKRVSANRESLAEAGFVATQVQGVVCLALKNDKFKNYIFKVFPDDKNTRVDWVTWVKRIKGAERIRQAIKKFGYKRYFKVPQKWIYPLPEEPSPDILMDGGRKNFILVVDNMFPIEKSKNWQLWREISDPRVIKRIMKVVIETGAGDAIRANNVPFCKDGKMAFLDTERTEAWPVNFHPMKEHLNHPMRFILDDLVKKFGGTGTIVQKPEYK